MNEWKQGRNKLRLSLPSKQAHVRILPVHPFSFFTEKEKKKEFLRICDSARIKWWKWKYVSKILTFRWRGGKKMDEKICQCKEISVLRILESYFFEPCFLVYPIFSTGNNLPRTESLCDVWFVNRFNSLENEISVQRSGRNRKWKIEGGERTGKMENWSQNTCHSSI